MIYSLRVALIKRMKITRFQKSVLIAASRIPMGKTMTYKELAASIGKPSASRAVGAALHRNPLPIIIPCHRVVASNGPGGYSLGTATKKLLLFFKL
ncbi:MAG: methylated-DNA--[protein]-cysteine S-methyltransferase [Candidatus Micrarchaeia archaeon]